jgi:sugar-specific transcriptional regulator TrmB
MSVVEKLKNLGLTEYESKIYLSIVKHGELMARELSDKSEVPYSKTYEVTSNLEKKGLIEVHKGRPRLFRAAPPKTVLTKYVNNVMSNLEEEYLERKNGLEKSYQTKISEITLLLNDTTQVLQSHYDEKGGIIATEDLIWSIRGNENVVSQFIELIRGSKSIKMIMHDELALKIGDDLKHITTKGDVILHIKSENNFIPPKGLNIFLMEDIAFQCGVIINDKGETMFTSKDLDMAFKSSNQGLLTILTHFFEHEKEEAKCAMRV